MADKQLIAAIAESGIDPVDAEDMVERVFGAVLALLAAGRSVAIPGAGRLAAPAKVVPAGFPPAHLRQQRRVVLRHGVVVEQGEPYPDPRASAKTRSTYGRR